MNTSDIFEKKQIDCLIKEEDGRYSIMSVLNHNTLNYYDDNGMREISFPSKSCLFHLIEDENDVILKTHCLLSKSETLIFENTNVFYEWYNNWNPNCDINIDDEIKKKIFIAYGWETDGEKWRQIEKKRRKWSDDNSLSMENLWEYFKNGHII